ncbi:MAG: 16S rRNA (uracil(1498)-N(3))-methyltransferase [Planctomycetota bacterium]|nr:MAG: 16S rRNA (uracil(1498)-N(3))-methyltransferase [Planctomycetota bacterium]
MLVLRRFFLSDFSAGQRYALSKGESYHIRKVLRYKKGNILTVFDGKGFEGKAEIVSIDDCTVEVQILEKREVLRELPLDIHLYLGLCKEKAWTLALKSCIELGVSRITPVICKRSLFGEKEKGRKKLQRWRKIAIESSKQCGANYLSQIENFLLLSEIEKEEELLLLGSPTGQSISKSAESIVRANSVGIIIGPEGGLEDMEEEMLVQKGAQPCSLGKHVLRVETAAIALVSAVIAIYEMERGKKKGE